MQNSAPRARVAEPRVHIGGKLALRRQHNVARAERQRSRGNVHAVGRVGDERDALARTANEPGRVLASPLQHGKQILRTQPKRFRTA